MTNTIGDIHGRTVWKELIKPNYVNIFVGDYFDPYHNISFEELKSNFLDIINFKKEHPETILLIGNHDAHYINFFEHGVSRFDPMNATKIQELFKENESLFQAAYSYNNCLFTHAGLSIAWYIKYKYNYKFPRIIIIDNFNEMYEGEHIYIYDNEYYIFNNEWIKIDVTPEEASRFVNQLWITNPKSFFFSQNADSFDYYGTTITHSPFWIREQGLCYSNIFLNKNYYQIYGHTLSDKITIFPDNRIMVDCLEYKKESLIY